MCAAAQDMEVGEMKLCHFRCNQLFSKTDEDRHEACETIKLLNNAVFGKHH